MVIFKKIIEHLFYFFVFLLPLQTRWIFWPRFINGGFWEYGSLSIYGTEILLWLILILFFIYLIISRRGFERKKINFKSSKFFILIAVYLLLITSFISIFWSSDKTLAAFSTFRLLEGVALFLFIVNFKFSAQKFWQVIVASAAVQGFLAFWQFATQSVFANKWLGLAAHFGWQMGDSVVETASGRWLRAYGLLPHPNMLAGFLVFGLIGVLYLWLRVEKKSQRCWLLFFSFAITAGLFFSFSRAGWLASLVAVGILTYVYLSNNPLTLTLSPLEGERGKGGSWLSHQNKTILLVVYFLFIFSLFALIFHQPFITRLRGGERLEIKSTAQRLNQFEQAGQLVSKNWLLGVGIDNYTLAVYKEIDSRLPVWDYQPVHNVPLLVFVELGIVGLIVILLYCYIVILYIWKQKNYFGLAIVSALGVILLFDHYLWTLYFGVMLFWLGIGVGCKEIE